MVRRRVLGLVLLATIALGASDPELRPVVPAVPEDLPKREDGRPDWVDHDSDDGWWRKNLLRRVLDDQRFFVTTWLPAEAMQPGFAVPLGAAFVAAATSGPGTGPDAKLEHYFDGVITGPSTASAQIVTTLGDAEVAAAILGTTYLVARWTGNDRLSRASSLSAEALINTAIWSTALKKLSGRARPTVGDGNGPFFQPEGQDIGSFPSGHAMGSFAVASIFAVEYRDKRWVPWVAYGAAGLVAASRVGLGRHFPSDVVAGAVLGSSLGRMVAARQHGLPERDHLSRIHPVIDPSRAAYGLAYSFEW